jgi:hypothetical protein
MCFRSLALGQERVDPGPGGGGTTPYIEVVGGAARPLLLGVKIIASVPFRGPREKLDYVTRVVPFRV